MPEIFYEDRDIIVVKKPAGVESQARHSFEPDMVSEIRRHICGSFPNGVPNGGRPNLRQPSAASAASKSHHISTSGTEPYVGVIHRLDKPVSGIMVYAKTKEAAAALSAQIQAGRVKKRYHAVVCGRCVDNVGNFVDYLLKDPRENVSKIVEKGINGAKRAELKYCVLGVLEESPHTLPAWAGSGPLSLVEIELLTGRHHQIRVQFAGHGLPLWGDTRYGRQIKQEEAAPGRGRNFVSRQLALCACGLAFVHPSTGKVLTFSMRPEGAVFGLFGDAGPRGELGMKPHT